MRPVALRGERAFTLTEVAVVLALIVILSGLAAPRLVRMSGEQRVLAGAFELVSALRLARARALELNSQVGIKFRPLEDGRVTFTLYRDGDRDGVKTRDIDRGIDPPLGQPRYLKSLGPSVGFGFPPGIAPRDPGDARRRLRGLRDPIRFNRSDIASFGPMGTSTPGSLYLTDGQRALAVVRVYGRTGKIRVLLYDAEEDRWRVR